MHSRPFPVLIVLLLGGWAQTTPMAAADPRLEAGEMTLRELASPVFEEHFLAQTSWTELKQAPGGVRLSAPHPGHLTRQR